MAIKTYATPKAFMIALNARLKADAAKSGRAAWRVQQLAIFERFLARVVVELADAIVLKGGLVLELRLARARTTKDVDTRFSGDPDSLLPRLQHAGRLDLHDFMTFEVEVDKDHSEIQAEDAKYGGKRFRVTCKIAGQRYGAPFGLDVGIGDPMIIATHTPSLPSFPVRPSSGMPSIARSRRNTASSGQPSTLATSALVDSSIPCSPEPRTLLGTQRAASGTETQGVAATGEPGVAV
jgi:hypothetical protein